MALFEGINTLDMTDNGNKIKVVNAMNNSLALKDYMNVELHICDCVIMPGIRKGRGNNPDVECKNVYLIDVDGNAYFSQSDGVARAAETFVTMWPEFGKETDEGYLNIKCVENELANGNTLKTLVFA